MLIINADDLGRSEMETDLAVDCYLKRRVTSATAMVFMKDSERAADLAKAKAMDVGLHINLCEMFTGQYVPVRLREYHDTICRFLGKSKYALLLYHPLLKNAFQYVFLSQKEEFIRLYGHPPSHMDGHKHMHLASNMLLGKIIPAGTKVRRSFTFFPDEKGIVNRAYRKSIDFLLGRRYRLVNYFFALPLYDSKRLENIMDLAKISNVELMTHPNFSNQYNYLMSEEYMKAISKVQLGSYLSL
jgi:chitin disaccharide deacetylase